MTAIAARDSRASLSTRFLVVGLLGSVVLAVLTIGLPLLELHRLRGTTLAIAEDSQKATYYIGEVGHQLARLRFHTMVPGSWEELADIEQRLQIAIERLPGSLDPHVRWHWTAVEKDALRLRQIYRDATNMARTGQLSPAATLLAAESGTTTRVHDSLDDLTRSHRASMVSRLEAVHLKASQVGTVALLLFGAFFAGLIGIFSFMSREAAGQRRRIAEYTARLESSNADLDAFAGRVAHDLKNALGPIAIAPDMLRELPDNRAMVLSIADRIDRSSRRTIAVVDSLLAFSRAAGRVEANEASEPREVASSVLEELAPQITKLDVHVDIAELPTGQIRCSPGLLHIVLANLCGNAVKYLDGRNERRVRISGQIEDRLYHLIVEDTGPGIPQHALEKIFEPFYRVPGVRAPGSGVGLATVRRIIEARGGRIVVDSVLDRGSRFTVSLPLV